MTKRKKWFLIFISLCSFSASAQLVKYDEGAIYIKGLTFLQDSKDSTKYFYLPRFPRLAVRDDGTFEFLCLQYVGEKQEVSGGLFHALIEFSVPDSILNTCAADLAKITPGARIMGQVPLMEPVKKDEEDLPTSFEIVSAVLSNKNGKDAMTRTLVTSGHAPFTPGSKAAVAAIINPTGSTLLWNSFTGPTSDVSVAVNGYYEAMVRAYNAIVTADMRIVYRHFSEMSSKQLDFDKEQIRKVLDTMMKNGTIKIDVADRSAGIGVKTSDMDGILGVITNKLTEAMFDATTGWSTSPEVVDPALGFNVNGRRGEHLPGNPLTETIGAVGEMATDVLNALPVLGWFSPKKDKNPKYVTDNQYVLKDVTKIRSNKFYLNLSKSVSIKVPFHTAGNLSGLYDKLGKDTRYFRIVNMADPAFQSRSINFQVDGDFVNAFDDIINFVTVILRKKYGTDHQDVTAQLMINGNDLKKDIKLKELSYPRLGMTTSDWLNYEYQVVWSYRGKTEPVRFPANENQWIKTNANGVSLIPPLVKDSLELDADRQEFSKNNVASVSVNIASVQAGERKVVRSTVLRAEDKSSITRIIFYHDKGSPVVFQPTWHSKDNGTAVIDMKVMDSKYIFLVPPPADKFVK